MPRTELIRRLEDLNPPTPAACLVLLWTYFEDDRVGLSAVENLVRFRWKHPLRLPEYPLPVSTSREWLNAARQDLRSTEDSQEFDILALRWLKALDILLNQGEFQDFTGASIPGMGGKPSAVQSRNAFIASYFEAPKLAVRWARQQGLSLAAYCRHFVVVPLGPVQGLQIDSKPASTWAGLYLHTRLLAECRNLRIMLWPFQTQPDYPGLENLKSEPPPEAIILDQLRNEPEILEEVERALAVASEAKVTLLIFPELSIPPRTEETIHQRLATHGLDGYPILTLFGCSHRPLGAGGTQYLNEAALLGPDGSELHRHRKLVAFTDYQFGEEHPVTEPLETGTTLTVLESALGNLAPLICIDLLNDQVKQVVSRCHANLFAVPSFSVQTNAHRYAAMSLQVSSLASTFVCNLWITPPTTDSTSFYQIPRKKGLATQWPSSKRLPYLLFDLQESLKAE